MFPSNVSKHFHQRLWSQRLLGKWFTWCVVASHCPRPHVITDNEAAKVDPGNHLSTRQQWWPFYTRINTSQLLFPTTLHYWEHQPFSLLVWAKNFLEKVCLGNHNKCPRALTEPRSQGANDTVISPSGSQKPPGSQRWRFTKQDTFKVPPLRFCIICDNSSSWPVKFSSISTQICCRALYSTRRQDGAVTSGHPPVTE